MNVAIGSRRVGIMARAASLLAVGVLAVVLAAGCSGDDKDDGESGNPVTPPVTPPVTSPGGMGADDVVPAGAVKINNFADLCKIGNDAAYPLSGTYEVTADIDASSSSTMNGGAGFTPIGMTGTRFNGKFYGKGHKITGLYINRPDSDYVGLFGYVTGRNNLISGVHIVNASVTGNDKVGALVGMNFGEIRKCSSSGTVTASSAAGGLAGWTYGNIFNSYSTAVVSGRNAGGLVGWSADSTIERSYASGSVSGTSDAGGLVGLLFGNITDCYSTGTVTGSPAGGLTGSTNTVSKHPSITRSYAAGAVTGNTSYSDVGGLQGDDFASNPDYLTITGSYWDVQATGVDTSYFGGSGKTTAQMKQQSTYSGWDFSSVWQISGGYPYLKALGPTVSSLSKAPAVVRTNSADAPPLSEAELQARAQIEYDKMVAETLRGR